MRGPSSEESHSHEEESKVRRWGGQSSGEQSALGELWRVERGWLCERQFRNCHGQTSGAVVEF